MDFAGHIREGTRLVPPIGRRMDQGQQLTRGRLEVKRKTANLM